MTYEPKPLDTSAVVLPPDVLALTEQLVRNTHEVWPARGCNRVGRSARCATTRGKRTRA